MKRLDPRLRRLVKTQQDMKVLRSDLQNAMTFSSTVSPGETGSYENVDVSPELVTKRCLVVQRFRDGVPPAAYEGLDWSRVVGDIYTVDVPLPLLESLSEEPGVEFIEAGRNFAPMLDSSIEETRADILHQGAVPAGPLTGQNVIVGIIDSALDFNLDDFRNADGTTRVASLWDQSLIPQAGEINPKNFAYGVEYDQIALNQAIGGAGSVRHVFEAGSHGTHVAGIAAGNGRSGDAEFAAGSYVGAAPDATIIFVKPDSTDQDTSFTDSARVADGIAYIFAKANELGLPCVINMSLGQNGGSHDGESVVERAIDELLQVPGRAFVSAAGNEQTWRGHSSGTLQTGDTRTLRWKAGGEIPWPDWGSTATLPAGGFGDFSPNEMEIWYSSRDRLRVSVEAPDGSATNWLEPGESDLVTLPNGNRVFIDSERFTVLNGDARIYIEVAPENANQVEKGEWLVRLEALDTRAGRFDAYIERDARRHIIRLTNGVEIKNYFADQSFFVGVDFDEEQSLGTPATSRRSIAVANYNHVTQTPNMSSSRGRTRDGRPKPEVAAPGTDIVSSNARGGEPLANGTSRPIRIPMTGTSMSAPHVTGIVALLLQHDPTLTAAQIQKVLVASADPPPGVQLFDVAWGYGRIDAEAAIAMLD